VDGFHNEFEDQAGTLSITQDQVIGRNPDYILTTKQKCPEAASPESTTAPEESAAPEETVNRNTCAGHSTTAPTPKTGVDEILLRADWQGIDAVSNKRVYLYRCAPAASRRAARGGCGECALFHTL
jgi:ABC-type Fe3+-hydroxamate transport system substrate-binding protein